jgi:hypothetical protein
LEKSRKKLLRGLLDDEGKIVRPDQAVKAFKNYMNEVTEADPSMEPPAWLVKEFETMEQSKTTKMTPVELEAVNEGLEYIRNIQRIINKVVVGEQRKEVSRVANSIVEHISDKEFNPGFLKKAFTSRMQLKETPEYGLLGRLKLAGPMNVDGYNFSEQFGSDGKKVFYDNLVAGDTVQNTVLRHN